MAVHIEITIPEGHATDDNVVRILGAVVRASASHIKVEIRPAKDREQVTP